ncbi:hypothetical protein ACJX0J_009411 [Zea mays]
MAVIYLVLSMRSNSGSSFGKEPCCLSFKFRRTPESVQLFNCMSVIYSSIDERRTPDFMFLVFALIIYTSDIMDKNFQGFLNNHFEKWQGFFLVPNEDTLVVFLGGWRVPHNQITHFCFPVIYVYVYLVTSHNDFIFQKIYAI